MQKIYTIGYVATMFKVSETAVRKWLRKYEIDVPRTNGNVRIFTKQDLDKLFVHLQQNSKYKTIIEKYQAI